MRRKLYEFPLWALEALMRRLSEADVLLKLDNWPADARVVAAHVDPVRQRVLLTVDSDSFPAVPEGGLLYVESPVFSFRTLPLAVGGLAVTPEPSYDPGTPNDDFRLDVR